MENRRGLIGWALWVVAVVAISVAVLANPNTKLYLLPILVVIVAVTAVVVLLARRRRGDAPVVEDTPWPNS